jgi:hypothetical protein
MTKTTSSYRHKLVYDDGADFVAYQCNLGDGVWQTVSVWMIPQQIFGNKRQGAALEEKRFA